MIDENNNTPLLTALSSGKNDLAKFLIEKGLLKNFYLFLFIYFERENRKIN